MINEIKGCASDRDTMPGLKSAWKMGICLIFPPFSRKCKTFFSSQIMSKIDHLGHIKRIWYLSPMRAAKVQASLRICAVSPEPPLLAHTGSESRGTFRQKARSLAPLNG